MPKAPTRSSLAIRRGGPVVSARVMAAQVIAAQVIAALLTAACAGPGLAITSDGPRYVDGLASDRDVLPFRYYGTTVVDVVPEHQADGSHWRSLAVRREIPLVEPVSAWLFPFDFPAELLLTAFGGAPETAHAEVFTAEAPEPVVTGYLPGGIQGLRERGAAARVLR